MISDLKEAAICRHQIYTIHPNPPLKRRALLTKDNKGAKDNKGVKGTKGTKGIKGAK